MAFLRSLHIPLHEPDSPEADNTLNKTMAVLKSVLTGTLNHEESFWEHYSVIYHWVFAGRGDKIYSLVRGILAQHLTDLAKGQLIPLKDPPNAFLLALARAYGMFFTRLEVFKDLAHYLGRSYIPRNNLQTISALGTEFFRNEVVLNPEIRVRIRSALGSGDVEESTNSEIRKMLGELDVPVVSL